MYLLGTSLVLPHLVGTDGSTKTPTMPATASVPLPLTEWTAPIEYPVGAVVVEIHRAMSVTRLIFCSSSRIRAHRSAVVVHVGSAIVGRVLKSSGVSSTNGTMPRGSAVQIIGSMP